MTRVGSRQNWLKMMIHSAKDTLAIDSCQQALSDLIALFNVRDAIISLL